MYKVMEEFIILLIICVIYAIIYSRMNPADFGFKDKIDPYYFSVTTMSAVGYGDLSPKTRGAKLLVMSQQLLLLTGEITLLMKYIGK